MDDIVQLPYSKSFAFIAMAALTGVIVFISYYLIFLLRQGDAIYATIMLSIFDCLCLYLTVYFLWKYFIPALDKQVAIELNKDGIIDNVRNNKIGWDNVISLRLLQGQTTSFIAIDLKNEKLITGQTSNILKKILFKNNKFFYRTPTIIATQYIKGEGAAIFNTVLTYFRRVKNCT